jgi:hypothetical protein
LTRRDDGRCRKRRVAVNVAEGRDLPGELRVPLLFARIKADVLEQQHTAILERRHLPLRIVADGVGRELDRFLEQLGKAGRRRLQAELLIPRCAFRPSEGGTLKSTRISTRFPRTSASAIVFLAIGTSFVFDLERRRSGAKGRLPPS